MFGWILLCLLTAAAALLVALSRPIAQAAALRDWGARVLFVIAHPDDEAMFMVPTIRALIERPRDIDRPRSLLAGADDSSAATEVHVLCLSSGNYDGLGATRTRELQAAARVLGVTRAETIEHAQLQDGPRSQWPADIVASRVAAYVKAHKIHTIATFDAGGVSGHPNHLDTAAGVRSVIHSLPDGVNVFELETTNIVRKYSGPLDIFLTYFKSASTTASSTTIAASSKPWVSYLAMQAHHSQFVWFRHLFVAFSRYTFVNSWRAVGERSSRKSS